MGRKPIIGGKYFNLHVRVTENFKKELIERANSEGILYTQLARQVILKYLSKSRKHNTWLMDPVPSKFKETK